jgi:hypothetical protein
MMKAAHQQVAAPAMKVTKTAKDQRSRELVLYRESAHRCAQLFREALELQNVVYNCDDFEESPFQAKALEHVRIKWNIAVQELWLLCGGNSKNLSQALHDVALALDGKLHGKSKESDDLIIAAHSKAVKKRLRRWKEEQGRDDKAGIDIKVLFPRVSEVDNARDILAGKKPVTKSSKPKNRKRSLRRRLKILGY